MTKYVQDTPSSAGVNMSFGGSEGGGGPNGIQVNPVGQVEELRNGKAVELKEDLLSHREMWLKMKLSMYQGLHPYNQL